MKIIYNKFLPFGSYKAINLFGVLFIKSGAVIREKDLNHESIHSEQMKELLYILFYVWYVIEWFIKFLCCWNFKRAYRSVSFEQEAYNNQNNMNYLNSRNHYCWFSYIFKLIN